MSLRGAGFRRTLCLIVIICARAAGSCLCCVDPFVVFCDCSCAVPFCAISPHSSSLSIGLWVFQLFIFESRTDVASRGWISTNSVPGYCHMCSRCCLLSVLVTLFVVMRSLVRCASSSDLFLFRVDFDWACGCVDCSSWSLRRMSRRGARFRRTSCLFVVMCARAAVCCRCWSLCSFSCDCSCGVPPSAISPPFLVAFDWACGCVDCSFWSLRRMSRRGAGFRRTSYRRIVVICACAAVCCR